MKKLIRLTESDLHRIVMEAVDGVLGAKDGGMRTENDEEYYIIVDIDDKGRDFIYGTDTLVKIGEMNTDTNGGILLQKEPKRPVGAYVYEVMVPKGTLVFNETSSTITVESAFITKHCIAKYGMWVDESF